MYLGVINLVDSHARRTAILADLAALGYAIDLIPAVEGRKSAARDFEIYNDRRARLRHGRSLNGGEVACYLSHIQTLQNFVASGADIGLILEDDMHLPADTRQKIDAVIACLALQHPRWQIANLTQHAIRCTRKIGGFAQHDIHRAYYFPMLTGANLWTRIGAQAFLASPFARQICGPYDTELRPFCAMTGQGISLDPPMLSPRSVISDIDQSSAARSAPQNLFRPILPRLVRHFSDIARARLWKLAIRR
jgi:glycosyl transferase, family 25